MKRILMSMTLVLALILVLSPVLAGQAMAADANVGKTELSGTAMVAGSEAESTMEVAQQALVDAAATEGMEAPTVDSGYYSYVFPDPGVVGAKWVKGDKIILPFHLYSSGRSGQYIFIYLYNSDGEMIAWYENKPFKSSKSYYTMNLSITGSENYAAGTYYLLYYSSYDDGNLNTSLIPIYVENYSSDALYNSAFVDPDFVNKHYSIDKTTAIPFKLFAMGYGAQEYFCGVYDSNKKLIGSASDEFDLDVEELSLSVKFAGGLRPGTYYVRAYSTYFTDYKDEYFPFYVDNEGVGWEFDSDSGELSIFGKGAMPDYTSYGQPWDNDDVKSVVIEPGITYIGDYMCYYGSVTSVTIPDTVTGIGTYAFYKNFDLTTVQMSANLQVIESYAFNSCSALTSMELANSLYEIGDYAFAGCDTLVHVTTKGYYAEPPANAYGMGKNAFGTCDNLVSFEVPAAITSVGYKSFTLCNNLSEVYFQDDAPMFDDYAFYNVDVTAYYPSYVASWTADVMQDYKGTVTWQAKDIPLGNVRMTKILAHKTGNIVYWDAVRHADLYQVFRRAADESSWTLIKNTRSFAYKDESAEVGVKYYYKVRAYNKGITSSMDIPALSAVRPYPLDSVKMTKILAHKTGNIVYWEAVENGDLYQIYRRANNESTWTLIKNTRSLAYKDESAKVGVKYYYKVRARNGDLMSSLDITALSATRPYPLDSVKMISAKGHASGIIVSWEAVENAQLYQIYRRASNESSWTLIKNTGSLAYKDETAVSGVKYYYKVVARNGSDMSSMDISAVSATRP